MQLWYAIIILSKWLLLDLFFPPSTIWRLCHVRDRASRWVTCVPLVSCWNGCWSPAGGYQPSTSWPWIMHQAIEPMRLSWCWLSPRLCSEQTLIYIYTPQGSCIYCNTWPRNNLVLSLFCNPWKTWIYNWVVASFTICLLVYKKNDSPLNWHLHLGGCTFAFGKTHQLCSGDDESKEHMFTRSQVFLWQDIPVLVIQEMIQEMQSGSTVFHHRHIWLSLILLPASSSTQTIQSPVVTCS